MELAKKQQKNFKDDVMVLLNELKVLAGNNEDDLKNIEEMRECFFNLKEKFTRFIQSSKGIEDFQLKEKSGNVASSEKYTESLLLAHYKRKTSEGKSFYRTVSSPDYADFKEYSNSGEKEDEGKLGYKNIKKSNFTSSKSQLNENQKQDWSNSRLKKERTAFEADVRLGQFYDVKTETFKAQYLFPESSSARYVETETVNGYDIKISNNNSLASRFNLFETEPEEQLSIIINSSNIDEGYGKYLVEENQFQDTLVKTLFYKYTTVVENLIALGNELQDHVNHENFKDIESSYVVVGIIWGMIRTLTLEHHSTENNQKEVEDLLNKEINSLKTYLESRVEYYKCTDHDFCKNLILKVDGSIQPFGDELNNLKNAIKSLSNLPYVLQSTKGVPLKCVMVPLSTLACNNVIFSLNSIDTDFVNLIINFFEELTQMKIQCFDLEDKMGKYFSNDYLSPITASKKEIDKIEKEFKEELRIQIPKLKSGELEIHDVIDAFLKYENRRKNCQERIVAINSEYSEIYNFINFCSDNDVNFLDKNEKLNDIFCKRKDCDFYVLYMSLDIFNASAEIAIKTFDLFLTMAKSRSEKSQYILVDFDVNSSSGVEIDQVVIMHYKDGTLISSNVMKELGKKLKSGREVLANTIR